MPRSNRHHLAVRSGSLQFLAEWSARWPLAVPMLIVVCMVVTGGLPVSGAAAAGQAQPNTGFVAGGEKGQLYVVGTSHLDTQWRWTIQTTITEYLPATLNENFALFDRFPHYVFSFEGAFRYALIREYYPAAYARLQKEIAAGRWRVAGSWLDAVDVNIPSPESLMRQTLYGNGFFRREFGVASRDVYLPDCFGFGFALPSVAAHCGLLGFSTQKLSWGSAVGIPFEVGLWEGVDGTTLVAALNPGAYVSKVTGDLSADSTWVATIAEQEQQTGVAVGLKYFGVGDRGGAPDAESVAWLESSLTGQGPLQVRSVATDQLARDLTAQLTAEQLARLPRYRGELLMTRHGVGCYSAQAAMKKWNRQNEIAADAAERAAVAAHWLGAVAYPRAWLRDAWGRFLWHQFHDDLTGTSIPEAYAFSWNDELLALNQFSSTLNSAVAGVCRALDTRVTGVPVVVYNPLTRDREDLVEAAIQFVGETPRHVRVFDPAGAEVPAQVIARDERRVTIVFLASVPATGFAVYDARSATTPCDLDTGLRHDASRLENQYYRVALDKSGNPISIFAKQIQQELLAGPIQLQLLHNAPRNWAAWELDHADVMAPPRQVSDGSWQGRLVEQGPARICVEVRRRYGESDFVQRISLAAGAAGARVEFTDDIVWREPATLLKVAFPVAAPAAEVTYDLGLGTIARGTNCEELYEVPAQRWADLTADTGTHGVAVLNDSRYGWDHPDSRTLRLTLLHTPAVSAGWKWIADQKSQDLGRHRVAYAVVGHAGDWRQGQVAWQADRFNQRLLAFQTAPHAGPLGRTFSLLRLIGPDDPAAQVAVRAVKLAEESNEVIVRLQELTGAASPAFQVAFAGPVATAREVNGAEEPLAEAEIVDGRLVTQLAAYQPRTYAVRLEPPPQKLTPPQSRPLDLSYNLDGISLDADRTDGDFDGLGHTLAGELLPDSLTWQGIAFRFGSREPGQQNVVACTGQRLRLPEDVTQLDLLAAAVGGARRATFHLGDQAVSRWIQDHATPVGQWDSRLAGGELCEDPSGLSPAYLNRDPVAWVGTHRHTPDGTNEAYRFTYLFRYRLPLPPGARAVTLPDDANIRILAATAVQDPGAATVPAGSVHDGCDETSVAIRAPRRAFLDSVRVTLWSPNPEPSIHYTLDGSEPDKSSPLYTGPLLLQEDATLTALTFASGLQAKRSVRAVFTRVEPRPALALAPTGGTRRGLVCRYFEGDWIALPDFGALDAVMVTTVDTVAVPAFAREEKIGLVLTGFIAAPQTGLYTFQLWSDDGSALYLGEQRIIDNDGLHGRAAETADVALTAGLHPLRLEFFQRLGGIAFELWWEGPGMRPQPVPGTALSHAPGQER